MMKNSDFTNRDIHNYWHHKAWFDWDDPSRWWGQIAGDCVDLNTEHPGVSSYIVDCYSRFIKMGVDGFRIDTAGHIPRLSFNKNFLPQLMEAAESSEAKAKRGNTPFFMFGEVCARSMEVIYRGENYNCSPLLLHLERVERLCLGLRPGVMGLSSGYPYQDRRFSGL